MSVTVSHTGLKSQILDSKFFASQAQEEIKNRIVGAKEAMMNAFDSHSVTIEILSGIEGSNISGTLHGVGNLFSFIGFEAGTNPIAPIREALNDVSISKGIRKGNAISFIIKLTPEDKVYAVSPLPFLNGRSWVEGIENGIDGLNTYLVKQTERSRSGLGIQSTTQVRGGAFSPVPYLSEIYQTFERALTR